MSSSTLSYIIMIVSCVFGIIYHEYGHMKVAKRNHITVTTFCIGFGKPFIKRTGKDNVTYGIAPVPFGGYCNLNDEELNLSPLRIYNSVLLAGVIRNLILGTILIVIGQLIIANRFVNPVILLQNCVQCFRELLFSLGECLKNVFHINALAAQGGFITQMTTTSNAIVASSETITHVIGMSLMMGGLMNYTLAILNSLPVPGLDGGQIVVRLICDFCKKVFHYEINPNIILAVNFIVIAVLCCYQGLLLLFDIPWVQSFFINL